jgi:hypothetical protein
MIFEPPIEARGGKRGPTVRILWSLGLVIVAMAVVWFFPACETFDASISPERAGT